jgi:hypothetical protein
VADLVKQALDAWHQFRDITAKTPGSAEAWAAHDRLVQANAARDAAMRSSATGPSSPTTSSPAPPPAKPVNPWITASNYVAPEGVKQADPDIVILDTETISPELLIQLEYENVSGTELINISRSDIIDGQQVVYSPIKNLSSLRRKYNPNNIIAISSSSASIFSKYLIDIIARGAKEPYFDNNGDLVIEVDDVFDDELIEAEVDTNGTIDTVEFS